MDKENGREKVVQLSQILICELTTLVGKSNVETDQKTFASDCQTLAELIELREKDNAKYRYLLYPDSLPGLWREHNDFSKETSATFQQLKQDINDYLEDTEKELTLEEDLWLGKVLEMGRIANRLLKCSGMHYSNDLTAFLIECESNHKAATTRLTVCNHRLIIGIALKYRDKGVSIIDLFQEGNLGLLVAVGKYEWRRNNKFDTLATWWVRQAISKYVKNFGRVIRLPQNVFDLHNEVVKVSKSLRQKQLRDPTDAEIETALKKKPGTIDNLRKVMQFTLSIEDQFGVDDDDELSTLLDRVPDRDSEDEYEMDHVIFTLFEKFLETLQPRERDIAILRFQKRLTLQEIGKIHEITRQRVSQIEIELREQFLRIYVDLR